MAPSAGPAGGKPSPWADGAGGALPPPPNYTGEDAMVNAAVDWWQWRVEYRRQDNTTGCIRNGAALHWVAKEDFDHALDWCRSHGYTVESKRLERTWLA